MPASCSPSRPFALWIVLWCLACGPAQSAPGGTPGPLTRGQPELIEVEPGTGQSCGGVAALDCQSGFVCEDDPGDGCDPAGGGTDCAGLCLKDPRSSPPPVECAAQEPARRYVEREPRLCAALFFLCHPDDTHFFDECGCGCTPGARNSEDPASGGGD